MLVLTRKMGESIVIGRDIELIVLKRKGRQVQLAITAPMSVAICRGELLDGPAQSSVFRARKRSVGALQSKQGTKS